MDNENLDGEEVQKTKCNPEPRIFRPWAPECQKRKHNSEPVNIRQGTPECKKTRYNPEPYYPTPQGGELNHHLPQNPCQQPQ